jgi:hypothetical protein
MNKDNIIDISGLLPLNKCEEDFREIFDNLKEMDFLKDKGLILLAVCPNGDIASGGMRLSPKEIRDTLCKIIHYSYELEQNFTSS